MKRLLLPDAIRQRLIDAARRTAPLECCGMLGGTGESVTMCYELTNADASAEHYSMLPKEQFDTVRDMREKGLKMLAIWHSHPETPARMSEEDMRLAYQPDVAYMIVSLADPGAPDVRAFTVSDGVPQAVEIGKQEEKMSHE